MQAQVNLSALNSEPRKKQITDLLIQNEDYLLSKFSGDTNIPTDKILAYIFKNVIGRVSNGDSIAEGLLDTEQMALRGGEASHETEHSVRITTTREEVDLRKASKQVCQGFVAESIVIMKRFVSVIGEHVRNVP